MDGGQKNFTHREILLLGDSGAYDDFDEEMVV